MTDEAFFKRMQELVEQEMKQPEMWHALSFALADKFLGFTIVRAHGLITAIRRAHELGINPGGEVRGYSFDQMSKPPDELFEKLVTDKAEINRLLEQWSN